MRLRCPRCKVPPERVAYEGVRADLCGQCGGYWLYPEDLKRILHSREQQWPEPIKQRFIELAEASNTVKTLICTRCGVEMVKQQFKDWHEIIIDQCPRCSAIWLDPGELEKIQIYWEYAEDNPDPRYLDVAARKAELQVEWQQRLTRQQSFADSAKALRAAARIMLGLPPD